MIVTLNGHDISREIDVQGATATDNSGGRADTCEIVLPDAERISHWQIEEGMPLEISESGFSTGEMYVDEVEKKPSNLFIIRARSLPIHAKEKKWSCFENVTLRDLLQAGANALDLGFALYGVNEKTMIRRVVQRNESWPEFLAKVFKSEGAELKFDGKRVLAIEFEWAFAQKPVRVLYDAGKGRFLRKPKLRTLRVCGGEITATATDESAIGSMGTTLYGQQLYDLPQAIRSAKNHLLANNVDCETYILPLGEIDTEIAAMSRIDLYGSVATVGNWFVSSVTHDFVKERSTLTLKRCIATIK